MSHKRNLISIAAGTALLFAFGATSVSAADPAKESGHQHQSGQSGGHGDMKSGDHHQCEHKMSDPDLNKDGKISREEFMKHHEQMFDKKDANKDGFLDEKEMHRMMKHMHEAGTDADHSHGEKKK